MALDENKATGEDAVSGTTYAANANQSWIRQRWRTIVLICLLLVSAVAISIAIYFAVEYPASKLLDGCVGALTKLCPSPSVCYPGRCVGAKSGGNEFRKAMLDTHNELRGRKVFSVYGANMIKMIWDEELENSVLGWQHRCCILNAFEHDSDECRRTAHRNSVGQNLFKMSGSNTKEAGVGRLAALSWYSEANKTSLSEMTRYKFEYRSGHFTQLMWAHSYRLGCAVLIKDRDIWIGCNYYPSGNFKGGNVFKPSLQPASKCPPGTKKGASNLCEVTAEEDLQKHLGLAHT